jgi:hypothetical protein
VKLPVAYFATAYGAGHFGDFVDQAFRGLIKRIS